MSFCLTFVIDDLRRLGSWLLHICHYLVKVSQAVWMRQVEAMLYFIFPSFTGKGKVVIVGRRDSESGKIPIVGEHLVNEGY